MNIVWILGSGFSQPLGGPLLKDLFSTAYDERIRVTYDLGNATTDFHAALARAGRAFDEQRAGANPEEFLELVDAANQDEDVTLRDRCRRLIASEKDPHEDRYFSELALSTRFYLAAACHCFMPGEPSEVRLRERWTPFLRWAERLAYGEQTVITFNYDLVVEYVAGEKVVVPLPHEVEEEMDRPRLLKLHGSVGWLDAGKRLERWEIDELQWRVNPDLGELPRIAIAGPGPTKRNMTREPFAELWTAAKRALEEANVIVFVGYRFPETDAEALDSLLSALRRNKREALTARIVLGPDEQGKDVRRLRGLVRWALADRRPMDLPEAMATVDSGGLLRGRPVISVEPLYSQDFLAVFQPDLLEVRQKRPA